MQAGAAIIINGRTQQTIDAALKRLTQRLPHGAVKGFAADLSTPEG